MTGNYYTTGQHTVVQRIGFYTTIILFPGLLVLGGYGGSNTTRSVEYWSSEVKCSLPDLSRDMNFGPSVNFIQDTVVACYDGACDKLQDGAWVKLADTLHDRRHHTTAVTADSIVLMGGKNSPTTAELVRVKGGAGSGEGFSLDSGRQYHCSVQISASVLGITGGYDTSSQVTVLSGLDKTVTTR